MFGYTQFGLYCRELDCSRTMATFAALIPKDTIFYSMIRRTPKRILFGIKGPERLTNYHSNVASSRAVRPQGGAGPPPQAANGVIAAGGNRNPTAMLRFSYRILVEFGSFPRHGFRVTVFPKTSLMAQLACRMEETMDEAHAEVKFPNLLLTRYPFASQPRSGWKSCASL